MVLFRNGMGVNTTKGANVMGVTLGRDGWYKCPFGAMGGAPAIREARAFSSPRDYGYARSAGLDSPC